MKDVEADTAPTLFDEAEEESVADLALESEAVASDRPTRRKDERQYAPTFGSAREFDDVPPAIVERSRPAILPMTLMVILGFVLGFAIDRFMMGGFQSAPPPTQAAAEESKSTAPPAAATAGTSQPGRAYSEQTITPSQPPSPATRSEAPPVPGDVPGGDAAVTPKPAAPASAAQTARLTIISTPTHAGVTVNGRWRGRTPLTLDTLRFGSYSVRVTQPGFSAPPEEVVLNARQPMRTLSVRLQPVNARGPSSTTTPPATTQRPTTSSSPREASSSYAGTIFVDSRPRGAKVLIDGKAMGTTPASIPDIPIGSHVVRLELADHRTWTTSTRVAAGEQTRVTGSLEPIR